MADLATSVRSTKPSHRGTAPLLPLLPGIFLLILLRLPSFFEGLWFDDEGVYAAVAKGLYDGKLLYVQTWDSKPPFIFLLYSLAGFLPWARAMPVLHLLALAAGVLSIGLVYLVALRLAFPTRARVLTTCFFAVFIGSCVFDGTSTEIEIWFLPVTLLVLYLLLRGGPFPAVGALGVLAFLIKPQAGFEAAAMLALIELSTGEQAGWRRTGRDLIAAGVGAAIALAFVLTILLATRTLGAFWYATFTFNLSYTATASRVDWLGGLSVDLRYLRILIATGIAAAALFLRRSGRLSLRGFVVVILINVELYCATLSGRAYNHYALQLAPGLSLLVGWVAAAVCRQRAAVQVAVSGAALLAAYFLMPSAVLGLNWQRSVYPRPNDYYFTFVREFVLGDDHQWSWRDAGGITRVTTFAEHYNTSYDPNETYFLYTTKPWLYALLKPSYTNKYMEWIDWYDVPHAGREERQHFDDAQIVILDDFEPNDDKGRYRAILAELRSRGRLTKVEQYGDFEIYRRSP